MKNRKFNRKKKPVIVVLDIIIAVLAVVTVGAGIFAFNSFRETYGPSYDADSFYWRLSDESYGQLVEMYYANEMTGVEADDELKQYYGVAKYFEAASYYHMYREAGDTKKAQEYQKEMQDAEEDMGVLAFVSDKIMQRITD